MKLSRFMRFFKPYFFEELYRKAASLRENGVDVINLAVGDPDLPTHKSIVEKAIEEIKNPVNHRYPNTSGNVLFRKSIARWHKRRHNIELDYDREITVLIGSKEGIAHLPLVIMNEGDYCIIPDPSYPTYRTGVWMVGGKIYNVALLEKNDYLVDLSKIPQRIVDKTKLIFLNYPNNPTSAVMDKNYMREIVKWARKREIVVALDCAYSEIYFGEPTTSIFEIDGAKDIAVEFYSVSKTYSMAGWRIGWIIGNSSIVRGLNTVKENIDSGPFNAIQNACSWALDNHDSIVCEVRNKFKERAEIVSNMLLKSGWRFKKPEGTCFIWAKPPVDISSIKASDYILNKTGVLLACGSGFGRYGEGYLRFSTTERDELLLKAIERISSLKWENL